MKRFYLICCLALSLTAMMVITSEAASSTDPVDTLSAQVDLTDRQPLISTFSIVGRDPATGELGVAVASKFFAVGNVVPWARADVGAVATQAYANTTFGWRGIDLLESGLTPKNVLDSLLKTDESPTRRQVGIVAADGSSITYTGDSCLS